MEQNLEENMARMYSIDWVAQFQRFLEHHNNNDTISIFAVDIIIT